MTQPRLSQFLSIGLAMVIYFTVTAAADAGFIVTTAETVSENPLSLEEAKPASSGSQAPEKPDIPPTYKEKSPSETAPLSGMSTPSTVTNVSGGGAVFAMLPAPIDIPTLLVSRLGPEGRVWLPPPFSTGIFRPPRFMMIRSCFQVRARL